MLLFYIIVVIFFPDNVLYFRSNWKDVENPVINYKNKNNNNNKTKQKPAENPILLCFLEGKIC